MIPKELLAALRTIEIHTARLANQQLSGTYSSSFKGQGLAFREVRPYQAGDDVRTIDWNVSARMNEAFVKVFVEEREMTVMLVTDFYDQGYERALALAAAKHDLVPCVLVDKRDMELPDVGIATFEDLESGESVVVDTGDPRVRAWHADAMKKLTQSRRQLFTK